MQFITRLIRRLRGTAEPGAMPIETAQQIVQSFADFLEQSDPTPGYIADASELPHDKETLKHAIATCIASTSDPVLIEHLRNGYLMLSAWQEGVGGRQMELAFSRDEPGSRPVEPGEELSPEGIDPWISVVEAEQVTLLSELKTMGAYGIKSGS